MKISATFFRKYFAVVLVCTSKKQDPEIYISYNVLATYNTLSLSIPISFEKSPSNFYLLNLLAFIHKLLRLLKIPAMYPLLLASIYLFCKINQVSVYIITIYQDMQEANIDESHNLINEPTDPNTEIEVESNNERSYNFAFVTCLSGTAAIGGLLFGLSTLSCKAN